MTTSNKRNYDLEEKLPLYALEALEEAEMKELDAYLQQVPEAAAELKKLQDAADLLPYAAPLRSPPTAIKSAVLNYAQTNPRTIAKKADAKASLKPQRPQAAASDIHFLDKLRGWWRSFQSGPTMPLALALSLLAIGIISNRLLSTQGDLARANLVAERLSNDVAALTEDLDQLALEKDTLETTVANLEAENGQLVTANRSLLTRLESNEQLIAYAADANSQRLTLPGTDAQPGASGGLFIRPDTGELLLVISELEPLSEEQIYQLWLIDDQPMSAGLIEITPEGTGIFEIDVALGAIEFSAVGVSVEPAGGSELPTGDIVMFAELSG